MPWSGTGLTVDFAHDDPEECEARFQESCVSTVEEALLSVQKIGYPIMIKASEGGGGKGIRKASSDEELRVNFRRVQAEVPGSPVFLMKLASQCRHLEVQVLADAHGNAIALYGRDCSVQRRHQKIIEEGPAVAAKSPQWLRMEQAAVRMAKEVGYVGVGTVEYLYDSEDNFFFLELNPRLQVEHTVTEMITDVNLPATQINVAMGIPLHQIPDIRRFFDQEELGSVPFDVDTVPRRTPHGHVIACRITAENANKGFQPTSGQIDELTFRPIPHVWGYFSVGGRGCLHDFADSQFGHIFAWGETREISRKKMAMALKDLSIRGDIWNTTEYLQKLLEMDDFIENHITTSWLDSLIASGTTTAKPDSNIAVMSAAMVRAYNTFESRAAEFKTCLERGQIPAAYLLDTEIEMDLIYEDHKYTLTINRNGPTALTVHLNGSKADAELRLLSDGGFLLFFDGKSHLVYGREEVSGLRLMVDGRTCIFTKEYDPAVLRTSMPGKLVRYLVEDGAHLETGQAFAEVEVMKMYLPLTVSEAGVIRFSKAEGSVLEAGDVLGTLLLDDPSRVKRAVLFTGQLPDMAAPFPSGTKIHQRFRGMLATIRNILDGYNFPDDKLRELVLQFLSLLTDRNLPLSELDELLSVVSGRIPAPLFSEISDFRAGLDTDKKRDFLGSQLTQLITDHRRTVPEADLGVFNGSVATLLALAERYESGVFQHGVRTVSGLIDSFLSVEKHFDTDRAREDVLNQIRASQSAPNLGEVMAIARAHYQLKRRSALLILCLDRIEALEISSYFRDTLQILAGFSSRNKCYADFSRVARQMLMSASYPSFEKRREALRQTLLELAGHQAAEVDPDTERETSPHRDTLVSFLSEKTFQTEPEIANAALELYLRRSYASYNMHNISIETSAAFTIAHFNFSLRSSAYMDLAAASADNLVRLAKEQSSQNRYGMVALVPSFEALQDTFATIMEKYEPDTKPDQGRSRSRSDSIDNVNILNIFLQTAPAAKQTQQVADQLYEFLQKKKQQLLHAGIRTVAFVYWRPAKFPNFLTFRQRLDYAEDLLIRDVDPALAFQLELKRLSNYDVEFVPAQNRALHVYFARRKSASSAPAKRAGDLDCRFFVRAIVRPVALRSGQGPTEISEIERLFGEALKALEVAIGQEKFAAVSTDCNHIFLNVIPDFVMQPQKIEDLLRTILEHNKEKLAALKVSQCEFKMNIKEKQSRPGLTSAAPAAARRITCIGNLVNVLRLYTYSEIETTQRAVFRSLQDHHDADMGPLEGKEITFAYPVIDTLQLRRRQAQAQGTTYVYDFPELFESVLREQWANAIREHPDVFGATPRRVIQATELVLGDDKIIALKRREAGQNDIGMVAWVLRLLTPECPQGRDVVVIANDITFQSGSFGPDEDMLFKRASEYARQLKLPRVYISANSGARIGLATEVQDVFRVAWIDPKNQSKGFRYLYLTPEIHERLAAQGSVNCERIEEDGEVRFKIVDIIGCKEGLGVENLRGSGMIAGETSQANEDIFTLSIVSGRTVGIGAYLVRLGQRVIHNQEPAIILTGSAALNKLLGREVYHSNVQLGGIRIMFHNGVSHLVTPNDFKAVAETLNWLAYVPAYRSGPLPILPISDPVDREIAFMPTTTPYDPRHMLAGYTDTHGHFVTGFFDRNSFTETMAGWARTVVVGRARLGGIPMGVVAVETRTVELVVPADPANPQSKEEVFQQPGQVWFPDSAFKTAQAIKDFNKGEDLPLMIFANWRGFSAGMRDMYNEVLKFGAYIVDHLREYTQPIFVYLPPYGELRGGSWVVVDPTINETHMEMFADTRSRGGVLEPSGTIAIKYRRPQVLDTMKRLDSEFGADAKRDEGLYPVFEQIATTFADLHDTPGRMKAKGVISEVVEWRGARKFFYWRLRRRLHEELIRKRVMAADSSLTIPQARALLEKWFAESVSNATAASDQARVSWLENNESDLCGKISAIHAAALAARIAAVLREDTAAALRGIAQAAQDLTPQQRQQLLAVLRQ
eukprot:TRINITY_DN1746_c0_g1_i1.p1 TRINITY_DN1746_c0_g1~~TRINITY_DN1746_c0_g1_i1.p1  ORF type:complete len:2182 (+),score=504.30 TRINITY_DN1746_c0_g1_i1:514-6546(+)